MHAIQRLPPPLRLLRNDEYLPLRRHHQALAVGIRIIRRFLRCRIFHVQRLPYDDIAQCRYRFRRNDIGKPRLFDDIDLLIGAFRQVVAHISNINARLLAALLARAYGNIFPVRIERSDDIDLPLELALFVQYVQRTFTARIGMRPKILRIHARQRHSADFFNLIGELYRLRRLITRAHGLRMHQDRMRQSAYRKQIQKQTMAL